MKRFILTIFFISVCTINLLAQTTLAFGERSATNIDLQDQIRILTSKRLNEEQSKKQVERKYNLLQPLKQNKHSK